MPACLCRVCGKRRSEKTKKHRNRALPDPLQNGYSLRSLQVLCFSLSLSASPVRLGFRVEGLSCWFASDFRFVSLSRIRRIWTLKHREINRHSLSRARSRKQGQRGGEGREGTELLASFFFATFLNFSELWEGYGACSDNYISVLCF